VRLLTLAVAVLAAALTISLLGEQPITGGHQLQWWVLAPLFYGAELAVVHLRFRRDAHSFSMSEIPLVLGLFFAAPLHLIFAQLLGNVLVLGVNRRQPPLKLVFNLSQFALQTAAAIVVFRTMVAAGGFLSGIGWVAAIAASLVALIIADVLINAAIRLTGGNLARSEIVDVFWLSALAAIMNTSLGLIAVTILWTAPSAAWLALVPPTVLFLAYRAYVSQQLERTRLESLYAATRDLHGSPQLEPALATAARHARQMMDAEFVQVVLFPTARDSNAYLTCSGPGTREIMMQPTRLVEHHELLAGIRDGSTGDTITAAIEPLIDGGWGPIRNAVLAPLATEHGVVGVFLAANRLGDIDTFGSTDVRLLATLAKQTAVSLENGRLEDSLEQLTVLKERLEGLVRSKDDFVASISHELRTPLTTVVGLAEELRDQQSTLSADELDEFAGLIADQSIELANIVEDLLVAARADTGSLTMNLGPVSVRDEIAAVLAEQTRAGRKPVAVSLPDPAITATADPLRFRQILRNLLTNAERYGGVHVAVEVAATSSGVAVTVSDDGPGVNAGSAADIFEPYQRGEAGRVNPNSVGLGLAVSRQLARLMDGDLHYERGDGQTSFVLSLPAT
jgi:K+-sensing histidine kinase KdpD